MDGWASSSRGTAHCFPLYPLLEVELHPRGSLSPSGDAPASTMAVGRDDMSATCPRCGVASRSPHGLARAVEARGDFERSSCCSANAEMGNACACSHCSTSSTDATPIAARVWLQNGERCLQRAARWRTSTYRRAVRRHPSRSPPTGTSPQAHHILHHQLPSHKHLGARHALPSTRTRTLTRVRRWSVEPLSLYGPPDLACGLGTRVMQQERVCRVDV